MITYLKNDYAIVEWLIGIIDYITVFSKSELLRNHWHKMDGTKTEELYNDCILIEWLHNFRINTQF